MDRRTVLKMFGASAVAAVAAPLVQAAPKSAPIAESYPAGSLPQLSASNMLQLNFNENSIGMSPAARQAVSDSLGKAFRYPDDQRADLISAIGKKFGFSDKYISLGNGSSENIQAIVQAVIHKAQKNHQAVQLLVPDPTFNYAELYAKSLDIPVVKIPLKPNGFGFDINAMKSAAEKFNGVSLFYLCNPNNPTSTITPANDLFAWIKNAPKNQFFLLDEAYAEFVTDKRFESGMKLVQQNAQNVAVTRTFSKLYALAGLRIGYAIAVPSLIEEFEAFMSLDNTNLAGAVAGLASIQDPNFQRLSVQSISRSRQIVENALNELGLKYVPSNGNFIFHEIKGDVKTYQNRMKENHILVGREFPPITGWSRLTLGTPEEMTVFVRVLKEFRQKAWV